MGKLEDAIKTQNVDGEIAPFNINQIDGASMDDIPGAENLDSSVNENGESLASTPEIMPAPLHPINETMAGHIVEVVFGAGYMYFGEGHEHWKDNEKKKAILVPMLVTWVNSIPELAEFVYQAEAKGAPAILIGMVVADVLKSRRINSKAKTQKREETANLYDGLLEANGLK